MFEALKREMKRSLKEMEEKTNKNLEKINTSLKENEEKAIEQVKEKIQDLKTKIETIKKTQTKGILEIGKYGKIIRNKKCKRKQHNTSE